MKGQFVYFFVDSNKLLLVIFKYRLSMKNLRMRGGRTMGIPGVPLGISGVPLGISGVRIWEKLFFSESDFSSLHFIVLRCNVQITAICCHGNWQ